MKKRIISLILASAMLLSVTGCSKKEQNLDLENITLEEYIEKVELPKNLTISIDPATVEAKETAKIYTNPEYMHFDIDVLAEKLLENPVTEREVYASGPHYKAVAEDGRTDILGCFDGGQACFGEDGQSVDGGFAYTYDFNPEAERAIDATYPLYPQMYDGHPMQAINCFRGIYQSVDKELDFASREEIAEKADAFLKDVGITDVEIHAILAYDTEALQAAVKYGTIVWEKAPEVQKSDEHYYVLLRQLLDGIPINTYALKNNTEIPFYLKYSEDGMISNHFDDLIQPPQNGTEESLISPVEALEALKGYYSQGVLLKPYTVESMELVYNSTWEEENSARIYRPYWLLQVSYQQDYPKDTDYDDNPLEGEIKAYDYIYFDAVTGEYFAESTSGKPVE